MAVLLSRTLGVYGAQEADDGACHARARGAAAGAAAALDESLAIQRRVADRRLGCRAAGDVEANQVVVVAGETGSGKSTRLPKLLLEELGREVDGMIGHTQPRRVAARAIAERVADEPAPRSVMPSRTRCTFDSRAGEATL